jgi:hypothetical protein
MVGFTLNWTTNDAVATEILPWGSPTLNTEVRLTRSTRLQFARRAAAG